MLSQKNLNILYIRNLYNLYNYSFFIQPLNLQGDDILEIRKLLISNNILFTKIKLSYIRKLLKNQINLLNYQNSVYILYSNNLYSLLDTIYKLEHKYSNNIIFFGLLTHKNAKQLTLFRLRELLSHKSLKNSNKKLLPYMYINVVNNLFKFQINIIKTLKKKNGY